ncbi:hypothetical protein [Maledivibacter halophilus]|uniref:Uncharacterized protein n=1 Tax=Maledivibacter halophilus TaxID=36842 RepID=A0A1T5LEN7_9FIRM|nr:hypothetical protein [Maledivibacter halophilus]SKC73858.1 hypothetical protein SAMN02194393_02781 [Maledivibacter halophilus]
MWAPVIIAIAIIFVTTILLIVLEKKEKMKKGTKIYKIIEFIGVYIPFLIICGYYGYMKTDTLRDSIIVISGIYICLALCTLFFSIWKTNKYNYIIFPIVIISCYFILNGIAPYMLSSLNRIFSSGLIGSFLGVSLVNNRYKGRLIISSILTISILITTPISFLKNFENNSKVENVSLEHTKKLGYDITNNDKVITFGNLTRKKPIHIWIVRQKFDEDWTLSRHFKITYFNGVIKDFSVLIEDE